MLQELRRRGHEITATADGNLKITGPEIMPELRARIKDSKRVILALLEDEKTLDDLIYRYRTNRTELELVAPGHWQRECGDGEIELLQTFTRGDLHTRVAVILAALRAGATTATLRDYLPFQPTDSIFNRATEEA